MAKIITKRQRQFINEIFISGISEAEALAKCDIDANTYRKWLEDATYQNEVRFYIESARRQGQILIARHCEFAAAKLVALAGSDKDETARKACLDIIQAAGAGTFERDDTQIDEPAGDMQIPPDKAERILEILAEK